MVKYNRLTFLEREEISRQIAAGGGVRNTAKILNRMPSTISREIRRFFAHPKYYRAIFAQENANAKCHGTHQNKKLTTNIPLRKAVLYFLSKKWSPEQIAKRLPLLYPDDMTMRVSHQTIYSYIYILPRTTLKKRLVSELRRHHKYCRKRKVKNHKPGELLGCFSIEERPQEVADRIIPGHWEGDLIVGSRNGSVLGTLVERTTRMTFLVPLSGQSACIVRKAFAETFKQMPNGLKKTLTYDHGGEMAEHKLFTKETNTTVYFAHPHSPWERGTNENTNSLVRQYFPKGTDFSKVSERQLKEVQDELNDRPRKVLGFNTPHEKFAQLLR